MTRAIGRALTAVTILASVPSSTAAQQLMRAQLSVGGVATTLGGGGPYLDAEVLLLPTTSMVGEVQLFESNATELVGLGGLRQRLFRSSQVDLYAQALFGGATGYSRRCDLCQTRVTEFGVGANIRMHDKWALRVRGDIRTGGSAADLLYPTLGVGITRRW